MAQLLLSELKPGDTIAEDVHSPLGSVLFPKGRVIRSRDLEILEAFLVRSVSVQRDGEAPVQEDDGQAGMEGRAPSVAESFHSEYEQTILLVKRTFSSALAGDILIIELRKRLESLFARISEYNILTFMPEQAMEEDYMYHHAVLSALTSYLLAKWVGLGSKDWMQVALAGLLHDIGNIRIDPAILSKPASLTHEEEREIRNHTKYGYQLLKNITAINDGVKLAALQHHEKVDGSGYPLGVQGDKIHPYAKIVAVADIYHAMTLNRVYKKKQSPFTVLEQLSKESFGQLDAGYVQTFIVKVTQFQNGALVRLNNGRLGEIVFTDRSHPTRPWVSIDGDIFNLALERDLIIESIIRK